MRLVSANPPPPVRLVSAKPPPPVRQTPPVRLVSAKPPPVRLVSAKTPPPVRLVSAKPPFVRLVSANPPPPLCASLNEARSLVQTLRSTQTTHNYVDLIPREFGEMSKRKPGESCNIGGS